MSSKTRTSLTESAWEAILKSTPVSSELSKNGYVEIYASNMKKISGREPRILAKMDFSAQRPAVFREADLNILPIQNGRYVVGRFDVYKKFETRVCEPILIDSPIDFQSIPDSTTSEGVALRKAEISNMLAHFCGEHVVHTFSGRERSSKFQFQIRNYDDSKSDIEVNAVQIEVDGGFEGEKFVYVFEVKNVASSDFNVRQLYFPYRTYSSKCSKKVRCIYLIHDKDVFTFYEYEFKNPVNMSSIQLVKSQSYYLRKPVVALKDIVKTSMQDKWVPDIEIPYPQADKFSSVIEISKMAGSHGVDYEDLKTIFDFSQRQIGLGGYYPNASRYLGLTEIQIVNGKKRLVQSSEFNKALNRSEIDLKKFIISRVLKVPGVKGVLKIWQETSKPPTLGEVVSMLNSDPQFNQLGKSTKRRRAQTVMAWSTWILQYSE